MVKGNYHGSHKLIQWQVNTAGIIKHLLKKSGNGGLISGNNQVQHPSMLYVILATELFLLGLELSVRFYVPRILV
jgi:hypothetical protein